MRLAHVSSPASPDKSEQGSHALAHPINVGNYVAVFGLAASGPTIEGYATVIAKGPTSNRYYLRFTGENIIYLRFVNPDWQDRPERSLALLREFWGSSYILNPSAEDFFPEISSSSEE